MRYHVTSNDGLKDAEFETYLAVLRRLGHSTDRELTRERQPGGSIYVKGGRIGIVKTHAEAVAVRNALTAALPYLRWDIEEVP